MLKIQSVNHVSEHLSAIYPVYTFRGGQGGEGGNQVLKFFPSDFQNEEMWINDFPSLPYIFLDLER
mgnify:CR=1 FL=1